MESPLPLQTTGIQCKEIFIVVVDMGTNIGFMLISMAKKVTQPIKVDLNKKLDPKQKIIQAFIIDA